MRTDAPSLLRCAGGPLQLARGARTAAPLRGAPPRPPVARTPPVGRALFFFFAAGSLTYAACGAWSVRTDARLSDRVHSWPFPAFGSLASFLPAANAGTHEELQVAAKQERAARLGRGLHRLHAACEALALPDALAEPTLRAYTDVAEAYLELPPWQQAAVPVLALNAVVFGAWQVLPWLGRGATMRRWWMHRPCSGRVATMLTSVFSHRAAAHFLFNGIAFWSVGASALDSARFLAHTNGDVAPEASFTPHMLAFFATAGTFASLVSHLLTATRWRMLQRDVHALARARFSAWGPERAPLASAIAAGRDSLNALAQRSSLGASGAVYAAFAASALAFPEAKLSIIFLPWLAVPVQWGIAGLVAVDAIGLVRGWAVFDHAAHIGGALFGLVYFYVGASLWEGIRRWWRRTGLHDPQNGRRGWWTQLSERSPASRIVG